MSLSERIQILEASHVRLMTDREVFLKEQEAAWRKHDAFVAEQNEEWKRDQERGKQQRIENAELKNRITELVGGTGEFMRQSKS